MTTKNNDVPRFDHLLKRAFDSHTTMVGGANNIRKMTRTYRRAAYRFAASVLLIEKHWHNEFLAHLASEKTSVDDWFESHFEVIEQMGDDRRNLWKAIEDGMTEAQYVDQGSLWLIKNKVRTPDKVSHVDVDAAELDTSKSPEEQVKDLVAVKRSQATEIRELRRDNARLLQECERLQKAFDKLDRIISARKKKTA